MLLHNIAHFTFSMQHIFSTPFKPCNFSLHLLLSEDQAVLRALSLHRISCVASDAYHFTSKVILFIQYRYLSLCQRTLLKSSYQDILTFVQYRCYGNEGRGKCDGLSCTWLLYGHVITPWTENMQCCEWGELRIHWNNVTWWNMSIHFELDDITIWIVLSVL